MKIAASRASGSENYASYQRWLRTVDPDVDVVDLHTCATPGEAVALMKECSGLLLTGGPDVNPARYGQSEKAASCEPPDEHRDALELALIEAATEANMPVLGICRGAQILNVAFGGTLIADIPTVVGTEIEHRQVDGVDSHHAVHAEPGSLIKRICRTLDGTINSAHHQSVERLATIFAPSATSPDGVIEAFEWGDAAMGGKPFLLAVQWHPERMEYGNPFSLPIAQHFVSEVAAYSQLFAQ